MLKFKSSKVGKSQLTNWTEFETFVSNVRFNGFSSAESRPFRPYFDMGGIYSWYIRKINKEIKTQSNEQRNKKRSAMRIKASRHQENHVCQWFTFRWVFHNDRCGEEIKLNYSSDILETRKWTGRQRTFRTEDSSANWTGKEKAERTAAQRESERNAFQLTQWNNRGFGAVIAACCWTWRGSFVVQFFCFFFTTTSKCIVLFIGTLISVASSIMQDRKRWNRGPLTTLQCHPPSRPTVNDEQQNTPNQNKQTKKKTKKSQTYK